MADSKRLIKDMTEDEIHALPEEEQRDRYFLPAAQYGATRAGFFKDCEIARCRRNGRCTGRLTQAQSIRGSGYHGMFPPCTRAQEPRRAAIIRQLEAAALEAEAAEERSRERAATAGESAATEPVRPPGSPHPPAAETGRRRPATTARTGRTQ